MQSVQANGYNYNDFGFSMQTSSGDTINLKLYDEKSSEVSYKKDDNSTKMVLSLTHSYGYKFSYEGNGIDAQDKKEIAKAMETIQPMLEKYMKNVKESKDDFAMSEITNKAFDINQHLPKVKDLNTKNYLNDRTLKNIDKILEKTDNQNDKMLKHAKKLFDSLLKQSDRFELYI